MWKMSVFPLVVGSFSCIFIIIQTFCRSSQVKWKKSDVKFEDRFDKYLDPSFFQHRVKSTYYLLINSFPANLKCAESYLIYGMFFFFVCVWFCTWQIHWFSIFNSFMMVIFLVGLVSMILMRTLRKDYARYSKEEEMDDMVITFFTHNFWNTLLNEPYESHHLLIYTLVLSCICYELVYS